MGFIVTGAIGMFIALPCLVVIMILHFARKGEVANYRAILETPTIPIAQLRQPGFVELMGRCVAGDQGVLVSPLTGRRVLGYYIDIKGRYAGRNGPNWRTMREIRDRREFWLDDGSGRRAWITPHEARAILPQLRYGGTNAIVIGGPPETVLPMTPQIDAWARGHVQDNRVLSVEAREIEEGAPLYALGWVFEHDGVMVMREKPDCEMFISTLSESQLTELLAGRAKNRKIFTLVTLAITAASLASIAIGVATLML